MAKECNLIVEDICRIFFRTVMMRGEGDSEGSGGRRILMKVGGENRGGGDNSIELM